MKKFLRELLVLTLLGVASVGALGQQKDQDKRPHKEPGKVVTPDKDRREPPPQNTNRPKPDNKKKPNF